MARSELIVDFVDRYLSTEKTLADVRAEWQRLPNQEEMDWRHPILFDDEVVGSLFAKVKPHLESFGIGLLIQDSCVARIDHGPSLYHMNAGTRLPIEIDRVVRGPHYHTWDLNKAFVRGAQLPPKLAWAVELSGKVNVDSLDAEVLFVRCFRHFCGDIGLVVNDDEIPEYPKKRMLF